MARNNSVQVFKGGWEELPNAVFTTNQFIIPASITSLHVQSDGAAIYVLDPTTVFRLPINTIPYDPNRVNNVDDFYTITDFPSPSGLCFNDDETEMYILDPNNKRLYQYHLTIPRKPSSIVDAPVFISLSDVTFIPLQCTISSNGKNIFITDGVAVYNYPLPIKDDITSNVSNSFFAVPGFEEVVSVTFKREGDKMYTSDVGLNEITEYQLSSPNFIDDAVPTGNVLELPEVAAALINPSDIEFRSNGKEFFIWDTPAQTFSRFHLDDQWDIFSASLFTNSFGLTDSFAITWKPDGTRFLTTTISAPKRIQQTDLLPNQRWNTKDAIDGDVFLLAGIAENARGMAWIFNGTRCILVDATLDSIVQLNSSGYAALGMTNPGISFSVSPSISPSGIAFTKDKLTAYVSDPSTDRVYQFDVTYTGSDITSFVYTGNSLLISADEITDIKIKTDDNLMYISDKPLHRILMFRLPPDGNVSNAVFLDELLIPTSENSLQGFFIRENDGKQLSLVGQSANAIETLDMSLEFNNSLITNFGDDLVTDLGEDLVYV